MSKWERGRTPVPEDIIQLWRPLYFEEGWTRAEIGAEYGCSPETVGNHLARFGSLRRPRVANVARYRRMIEAAEAAPFGTGVDLAARFGLTLGSWRVALHHARRYLARQPER